MNIQIHHIGSYLFRNYLLQTPLGFIAIDTGYPGGCQVFMQRFEKIAPLDQLKYIFLTHHHDDHAGFLAELLNHCDAKVVLHPLAVDLIKAGKNYTPPGSGYSSFVASLFGLIKRDFDFPSVELGDRAIIIPSESDQLFQDLGLPIRILFLPGHTAESIGLFLPETGELFCGDAAMNAVISIAKHTIWIDDPKTFGDSWDKMLACHPKKIYPSHGNPFSPKELVKHRHFMDKKNKSLF